MITKKPAASGKTTSVAFTLPAEAAQQSVAVVGSFNGWSDETHVLKLDQKKGVWTKSVALKPGRHAFRYLLDGAVWANEPEADAAEPTPFFSENSVVVL